MKISVTSVTSNVIYVTSTTQLKAVAGKQVVVVVCDTGDDNTIYFSNTTPLAQNTVQSYLYF